MAGCGRIDIVETPVLLNIILINVPNRFAL